MSLASIFATAILPVLGIAAAGFLLGRARAVDVEGLNAVTVYVLAPALIFHSLATTALGGGVVARVLAAAVGSVLVMALVGEVAARLLGMGEPIRSALVLVAAFPNAGNFGIPISAFAFGAVGRSTAVLFLAGQAVLIYTLGVYVAARSGGRRGLVGVKRVFSVPLVYAVAAAGLARWAGVVPPADGTAMVTIGLVGDAAIPVMLLILGIQLAGTDLRSTLGEMGAPILLRLGVAPVAGAALVVLLGIDAPAVARTVILEAATPAAVTPLILLVEFGGAAGARSAPEYVTTAVFVTTLASVPVLTLLIAILESGAIV